MRRFFAPDLDPGDETVVLPRDEAEHLVRVLRASIGDEVAVFDGRGNEFLARVDSALRRDVRLTLLTRLTPAAEPGVAITLVQAVLKGDKMDDVVRDAVMLGASAIQPVVTERVETTVAALLRGQRVERWRRIALASAKQSGRAVLPEVRTPLAFNDWLSEPRPETVLMLVEPRAMPQSQARDGAGGSLSSLRDLAVPRDAAIVVGPEGGWTAAEIGAAGARGLSLVTLGERTLRADAVPIAAMSIALFQWKEL
jgi:16S rRNA (uracil1498-N3)-methyltransferase